MNSKRTLLAALLAGAAHGGYAACPADGATPLSIGPVSPVNGFPEYVIDSEGNAVQICLDEVAVDGTPVACLFDPPDPSNGFSTQIGFGAEGFWWLAETSIDTPRLSALLVQAVEAAFIAEVPIDGEQFPFTRLRIRIDLPEPGIYTVTHPYGEETFVIDAVGDGQEVRESFDIEFAPNSNHQGRVGPLLKWDDTPPAAPPGYLGDGLTEHPVTGSPCGTNFLRIVGFELDGITPIDLDGAGSNLVENDLFIVTGQSFDGDVQAPLSINRSTYVRDAAGRGQVDLFASSATSASVSVSGGVNLPPESQSLTTDGNGLFFADVLLADASVLPATVTFVASNPGNEDSSISSRLVDEVTIQRIEYDITSGELRVEASSSDAFDPPVLNAVGFGEISPVGLTVPVAVPPAEVTVTSSAGGADTEPVRVVAADVPGNTPPVARDDLVVTDEDVPILIDLLADNGNGVDFDPDQPADQILPDTVQIGLTPLGNLVNHLDGTLSYTPPADFNGVDGFTYTVRDSLGAFSNQASVEIRVEAINDAPVAAGDTAFTNAGEAVLIPVLDNDSDVDGDAISLVSFSQGANGTVVEDAGQLSYTPIAGFSGVDSFTYTLSDGALEATAVVTVTVNGTADELTVTRALFRTDRSQWLVRGLAALAGPNNNVTIHLGPDLSGPVLATVPVNTIDSTWRFLERNSATPPGADTTLSFSSDLGAELLAVPLEIRP